MKTGSHSFWWAAQKGLSLHICKMRVQYYSLLKTSVQSVTAYYQLAITKKRILVPSVQSWANRCLHWPVVWFSFPQMEVVYHIDDEDEELTFEDFLDKKMGDLEPSQVASIYSLACNCLHERKNRRPVIKQVQWGKNRWTLRRIVQATVLVSALLWPSPKPVTWH